MHVILLSSDWSAEPILVSDWQRGSDRDHMWPECLDNEAILRFISRLGGKQCGSYFLVKLAKLRAEIEKLSQAVNI